jgi:hypothetical protein
LFFALCRSFVAFRPINHYDTLHALMANIADYMFSFLRAVPKPVPVHSSANDPLLQALHQLGDALRQRGGIVQQSAPSSGSCESTLSVANAVHSKFGEHLELEDDSPCTLPVSKKRRRSHLLDETLRLGSEVEHARALSIVGERTMPSKYYLRRFINERPSFWALTSHMQGRASAVKVHGRHTSRIEFALCEVKNRKIMEPLGRRMRVSHRQNLFCESGREAVATRRVCRKFGRSCSSGSLTRCTIFAAGYRDG